MRSNDFAIVKDFISYLTLSLLSTAIHRPRDFYPFSLSTGESVVLALPKFFTYFLEAMKSLQSHLQ